jgi:hypothetical protein
MATILVNCPHCSWTLEVDKESGKVVGKWEARKAGVDPMQAALEKMKADKEKAGTFFQDLKKEQEAKKKEAERLFEKERERLRKEGKVERPPNPFDLD